MTPEMWDPGRSVPQSIISFGPFLLSPEQGTLERRVPVRLNKRALAILLILAGRAPEPVDNKSLVAGAWPDRIVKEGSLYLQIRALRRALGERGSGARYVTNVTGSGYCFVAPISRLTFMPSMAENSRSSSSSRSTYGLDPKRLRRVLEFVEANLQTDITVDTLAAAAALSRFHFSRAFLRATGKTPRRFVSDRRLESAKALLVEGTMTLGEIAAASSFSSQASFTRAFRRAVGLSPGEYRRRGSIKTA